MHFFSNFRQILKKCKGVSPCIFWVFGSNLKKCKGVSSCIFSIFGQNLEKNVKWLVHVFFFQAEDGIRDRSPSRGLGDVYKRQM